MEIKDFVKDNKLQIPEDEIDNIYIWTKISSTQDVLMSSEVYHKWMKKSFETDTQRYLDVLRESYPLAKRENYLLSDFITFSANDSIIYPTKKSCFVYSSDPGLLISLICYTSHTRNVFHLKDIYLTDIIFERIDDPEKIKFALNSEMLDLTAMSALPEHKLKRTIISSMIAQRCSNGLYTFVLTNAPKSQLFDNDELLEDRVKRKGGLDINPLIKPWKERRTQDYHGLMSTWYSMLADNSCLVYSKTEPTDRLRRRERY